MTPRGPSNVKIGRPLALVLTHSNDHLRHFD